MVSGEKRKPFGQEGGIQAAAVTARSEWSEGDRNMLVAERYQYILRLVNSRGSIRVSELSEICRVTEETIRRDLDRLESEGRLQRSYGGAMRISPQTTETSYQVREASHVSEKQRISTEAVKYVEPNDRIVLDASTTAWHMASQLPDIPLTVLTNSLKVSLVLSEKKNVTVISTGAFCLPIRCRTSVRWPSSLLRNTTSTKHSFRARASIWRGASVKATSFRPV